MKEIINLLETARFHIDGQMNCNTPEYHALDHLHRAVDLLAGKIQVTFSKTFRSTESNHRASHMDNGKELPGMLAVAKGIAEQRWPHTMDAAAWASEFVKLHPGADEGDMLGWFANVIMAGYDTASARPEGGTREAVLDEIEMLIGAAEGRHFAAIATATSEDDKRRHGIKVAFAMELRSAIRALKTIPSPLTRSVPIAEATVPMLDALNEPCKNCGKKPIDLMEFS